MCPGPGGGPRWPPVGCDSGLAGSWVSQAAEHCQRVRGRRAATPGPAPPTFPDLEGHRPLACRGPWEGR